MTGQYYGKYRGKVVNNVDPRQMGRIQIQVPSVTGDNRMNWAMPCVPYGGPGVGFFMIPPVDASVWIEFESGDPDYPIWSGCFWDEGDAPASPALPETKMIKTQAITITINDAPGLEGVKIETANGMKIAITPTSIEIDNGQNAQVKLQGPTVSINGSALEVT